MTLVEVLLGFAIALAVVLGAVLFAFRTPKIKGLSRHGIRGDGDYADRHHSAFAGSFGEGSDGGGD